MRNKNGCTALLCLELLIEKKQSKGRSGIATVDLNSVVEITKMLIRYRACIDAQVRDP